MRSNTRRTQGQSLSSIIANLNPAIRGWFEYFKHARPETFKKPDGFIRRRRAVFKSAPDQNTHVMYLYRFFAARRGTGFLTLMLQMRLRDQIRDMIRAGRSWLRVDLDEPITRRAVHDEWTSVWFGAAHRCTVGPADASRPYPGNERRQVAQSKQASLTPRQLGNAGRSSDTSLMQEETEPVRCFLASFSDGLFLRQTDAFLLRR